MLEVFEFLRANEFKSHIVTGGGQQFVRAYSERVYGIPPEQVIGSSVLTKYQEDKPKLLREPKVFFVDDFTGKAIGINLFIGKRPCAAFGNSGGDQQMLEWTQGAGGARLMMLVLHDDRSASTHTHTVPLTVCRIPKLALFPIRLWRKQRRGAGRLLA
jgi:hypothetical protein